jgi:F-type H+-transporting ATPase subunit b
MSPSIMMLAAINAGDAPNPIARIVHGIMQEFGINLPGLLAQMLSFCIVVFILWKFAFKPVLATIGERQQKIDSGLKYAEEMKAKLEAAQAEIEARTKEALVQGRQIVADAQKAAKELADRQQKDAGEKAAGILAKAQEAIELEKKKMLAEARGEIARLVVATAERVLAQQLSEPDRARYNESAARDLAQDVGSGKL